MWDARTHNELIMNLSREKTLHASSCRNECKNSMGHVAKLTGEFLGIRFYIQCFSGCSNAKDEEDCNGETSRNVSRSQDVDNCSKSNKTATCS